MMNLISDYPNFAPQGAFYLPYTRRREYLSVIDKAVDRPVKFAKETKTKYTEGDTHTKEVAIQVFDSFFGQIKTSVEQWFSSEEQERSLEKLNVLRTRNISELAPVHKAKDIYERIITIYSMWVMQSHQENPQVITKSFFSLTEADFLAVGQNYQVYLSNKRSAQCHDYAFYKLNEVHAFPYIFKAEAGMWPSEFVLNPLQFMPQWGYEQVENPTPGDLVVYCSTLKGFLQAKHWGIWTSDKKVLSKLGSGDVAIHPIEDVILGYGNFVYFFHKKIKSPVMTEFLKEVDEAIKSVEAFSHVVTYSPLSSKGCLERISQQWNQIEFKGILKGSIYNAKYNEILKLELSFKLRKLSAEVDESVSKAETLATIRNLIFKTSDEVKGDI